MTQFRHFGVDDPKQERATIQVWASTDDFRGSIFLRKTSLLPRRNPDPHTPCWQVAGIDVLPQFRRQGFGTKLYEEAARVAARHGMHLCSDVPLSIANEALAFWEKQVEKGRAFWEVPGGPEHEGENYDDGRFVLHMPVPPSLSGRKAPTGNKTYWRPGEMAYFEYHCCQSHASADAEIWYRSQQPVKVIGIVDKGGGRTMMKRIDYNIPRMYRVRFEDGLEWTVFEDELLTSSRYYDAAYAPGKREA